MTTDNVADDTRIDWAKSLPFFILWGIAIIGPFFTGVSWASISVAIALYWIRMFFVTGFNHRYFSHKTFTASERVQNVMGILSCTAIQKGPVWWAYTHRHHHDVSDTPDDVHSVLHKGSKIAGFWWAHVGWILCGKHHSIPQGKEPTDHARNEFLMRLESPLGYLTPPVILGALCFAFGEYLGKNWNTSGAQMLVVGFFLSTFVLFNATSAINSLAHTLGKVRYRSGDHSKNSFWLALFTLGEGWHNNHHYRQSKANQGETTFELCFDWTYWILWLLHKCHIIHIPESKSHRVPRPTEHLLVEA